MKYSTLTRYIKLNREEKYIDEMLLNSTILQIKHFLRCDYKQRTLKEMHLVEDAETRLFINRIQKINRILLAETREEIRKADYSFNPATKIVSFLTDEYEGKKVLVEYTTGFTEETLPADIKEAIVKLFMYKKAQFNRYGEIPEEDYYDSCISMPRDVQEILSCYREICI